MPRDCGFSRATPYVKLKIHQLELCSTHVACDSLQAFLHTNNNSMQSIAFHDAHFIEQSWADNQLKPADVYKMIGIPVLKTNGTDSFSSSSLS
jgi:hypothetical protein